MEEKLIDILGLKAGVEKLAYVTSEACKLADRYVKRARFKFKLCGIGIIGLGIGLFVAGKEALALEDDISELRKEIKKLKESDREE